MIHVIRNAVVRRESHVIHKLSVMCILCRFVIENIRNLYIYLYSVLEVVLAIYNTTVAIRDFVMSNWSVRKNLVL